MNVGSLIEFQVFFRFSKPTLIGKNFAISGDAKDMGFHMSYVIMATIP